MASSSTSTSARLRKTFKYPDNEDSGGSRDEMDEEEQTNLISSLKSQEANSNATYRLIFTLLPIAVLPVFLFYLFSPSSPGVARLLSLLAITSLLASAFTMTFVPISPSASASAALTQGRGIGRPPPLSLSKPTLPEWVPFDMNLDPDGPLLKFLPWLNMGICALLCLASFTMKGKQGSLEALWLFLLLPAVMLGMITVARQSMRDLEEGIGGLERLRYDYKGA